MKKVKELLQFIKKDGFVHHAHNNQNDGKCHVLYLSPFLNATGLYRSILPTMRLNETQTHAAAINQVREWGLKTNLRDFDIELAPTLIDWADYIMFPTVVHDISKDITTLREINIKPHLQFGMDIDDCIHKINPAHPQYQLFTKEVKDNLLKNMSVFNFVTGTNNRLLEFYKNLLKEKYPDAQTEFVGLPNLMDEICYEEIDFKKVNGSVADPSVPGRSRRAEATRIGMTLRSYMSFADINPLKKTLKAIQEKYKNKVEFIVFGWNGVVEKSFQNVFAGIKITHIRSVPIYDYFQTMQSLNLDFALLPLTNDAFSTYKSHHKLLQYSRLGIPCIVSNTPVFTEVIQPAIVNAGEAEGSGDDEDSIQVLVAEKKDDWYDHICYMIDNSEKRREMGRRSQECARINFDLKDNINLWQECFY